MRRRGILLLAVPAIAAALMTATLGAACRSPESDENLKILPKDTLPQMSDILQAYGRGEFQACEDWLRFRLESQPDDTECLHLLAKVFRNTNRASQASQVMLSFAMSPKLDSRQAKGAIDLIRELVRHAPKKLAPHKALALCLSRSGDLVNALQTAQEGLRIRPDDRDLNELILRASEKVSRSETPDPRTRNGQSSWKELDR